MKSPLQTQSHSHRDLRARFMSHVYMIMSLCLFLTLGVAYYASRNTHLMHSILTNRGLFGGLLLGQLLFVWFFSRILRRFSASTVFSLTVLYSILSGLTLSVVMLAYTSASIIQTLGICAASFAGLSAVGYFTKRDLGPVGSFCYMGLIGLIILSIGSFFIPGLQLHSTQLAMSAAGILIFSGLTAYDTQKIKQSFCPNASREDTFKMALCGALSLYLDLVNLFLELLEFTGKRR